MSEISEYMKKVNDKLESARILYDAEQYATSVSASYYAMFLAAKALLIKAGYKPKSHSGLISLFGEVYVLNGDFDKNISKFLSRAQSLREEADYDAFDGITSSIASAKLSEANIFVSEARKFL